VIFLSSLVFISYSVEAKWRLNYKWPIGVHIGIGILEMGLFQVHRASQPTWSGPRQIQDPSRPDIALGFSIRAEIKSYRVRG
jgi:hypothetical protein